MNRKMPTAAFIAISFALFSFHKNHSALLQEKDNELSAAEKKAGWVLLFDGKTTDSWRNYQNKPQDSWEVINGELHCKKDGVHQRADLVTNENYA
ncbi:MAG TPA: family 16 glycoside hydrolase, partial [Puia sp.]